MKSDKPTTRRAVLIPGALLLGAAVTTGIVTGADALF